MPKAKSKRKKLDFQDRLRRKEREQKRQIRRSSIGPTMVSAEGASELKPVRTRRGKNQLSPLERAEGFFQVASLLPFFLSAWISNGPVIENYYLFTVMFGALTMGIVSDGVRRRQAQLPFPEQLQLIVAVGAVGLTLLAYAEVRDTDFVVLLAASTLLRLLQVRVEMKSVFAVLLVVSSVIMSSSVLAPLGAFLNEKKIYLPFTLFGFVPACLLGAAMVARYARVFESAGWKRTIIRKKGDGTEQIRPGSLSQLFTFLLVLGPLVPALLVPFQFLPSAFTLVVLSLYRVPKLGEGFLKDSITPENLYIQLIYTAFIAEGLLLLAAFF